MSNPAINDTALNADYNNKLDADQRQDGHYEYILGPNKVAANARMDDIIEAIVCTPAEAQMHAAMTAILAKPAAMRTIDEQRLANILEGPRDAIAEAAAKAGEEL